MLEDGAFVVANGWHSADEEGRVFFAVFRCEDGLLIEHWRFLEPFAPPNRIVSCCRFGGHLV